MMHLRKFKEFVMGRAQKYGEEAGYESRKVGRGIITKGLIKIINLKFIF